MAEPETDRGEPRPRPLLLSAWVAAKRRRPEVVAVYPDPTGSQLRPGCPAPSASAEARARAIIADLRAYQAAQDLARDGERMAARWREEQDEGPPW